MIQFSPIKHDVRRTLPGLREYFSSRNDTDEVDLVILNEAGISLAFSVVSTRTTLSECDPEKRIAFETRIIDRYLDFEPLLRVRREYILNKIREGTFFA